MLSNCTTTHEQHDKNKNFKTSYIKILENIITIDCKKKIKETQIQDIAFNCSQ